MQWLRALVATLVATFVSLALPFAIGIFVPVYVPADQTPINFGELKNQVSLEDLDRATRAMKERVKPGRDPEARQRYVDALRDDYWWTTWFPWLFLPLVVRIPNYRTALLILLPPCLLALAGGVLSREIAAFVIAFVCGILIARAARAHHFWERLWRAPPDR